MQLSVIILNYNVRHFLELCVLSVLKATQNIATEIIVVDNNSSDDSCQMIKDRFPSIKLIENKENFGFPKGNNIGVAVATGEYVCILNPDTVVAEDTFDKVLAFAKSKANLGIVGCKLIDGTGHFLPESKRGIPSPFVALTKVFGLYKVSNLFGKYYAQHLKENETGKVDILVGAFMVMKRELYLALNGFDENCFMYSDDIDLSYRALLLKKDNYYFHETTILHYKGESTLKDGTYMKRFQEAMTFFYQKHFKVSYFFSFIMRLGILYYSFIKTFQGKQKVSKQPQEYVLFSCNDKLKTKLENLLNPSFVLVEMDCKSINYQRYSQCGKQIELIFDNNYFDFKTILQRIEENKKSNFTFKIIPQSCNYLIGSNSSRDRGEIIKFYS